MMPPGGKLTPLACHPNKKVNKAEQPTNLSTNIGSEHKFESRLHRKVTMKINLKTATKNIYLASPLTQSIPTHPQGSYTCRAFPHTQSVLTHAERSDTCREPPIHRTFLLTYRAFIRAFPHTCKLLQGECELYPWSVTTHTQRSHTLRVNRRLIHRCL